MRFRSTWKPRYRSTTTREILNKYFSKKWNEVVESFANVPALCLSCYESINMSWKTLCILVDGGKFPFVVDTFCLNKSKGNAANLDRALSKVIKICLLRAKIDKNPFGFYFDSLTVMAATQNLFMEGLKAKPDCVVYYHGYRYHVLPNFVKDICKNQHLRNVITQNIKLAWFFWNPSLANDSLSLLRSKIDSKHWQWSGFQLHDET